MAIHPDHGIERVRKLVPTYEERLVWGHDGHGLGVSKFKGLTISALNCWENGCLWLVTPATSGADLHIAIWPGSKALTEEITRFVAKEGRVFVLSASALLHSDHIP